MSGRDYNSEQKKVDGGWAMMVSFMREGGGQSVQVCVVGSSEDRGARQSSVMVTFCRGKTVAKRGAYTVSSVIPATADANPVKHYLSTGTSLSPLFPSITGRAIKQALRSSTGDQHLEQRQVYTFWLYLPTSETPITFRAIFLSPKQTAKAVNATGTWLPNRSASRVPAAAEDLKVVAPPPISTTNPRDPVTPIQGDTIQGVTKHFKITEDCAEQAVPDP